MTAAYSEECEHKISQQNSSVDLIAHQEAFVQDKSTGGGEQKF